MTPEQAKEILNQGFRPNFLFDPETVKKDKKYNEFVNRFHFLMDQLIKADVVARAKIKVISDNGVPFIIRPSEIMPNDMGIGDNGHTCAAYGVHVKRIEVFSSLCERYEDMDLIRILSHEIEHAYKAIIHGKRMVKDQKEKKLSTAYTLNDTGVPYYPPDEISRKSLAECIRKGDERILNFLELLTKEEQKEQLTEEEGLRLGRYKKIASLHFPRERTLVIDKKSLPVDDVLLNSQYMAEINASKKSYKCFSRVGKWRPVFQVEQVTDKGNDVVVRGHYVKGDEKTFNEYTRMYALIYEILQRDARYKKENEREFLAEQHARTIGELSWPIIECFYPEVVAYDERDTAESCGLKVRNNEMASLKHMAKVLLLNSMHTGKSVLYQGKEVKLDVVRGQGDYRRWNFFAGDHPDKLLLMQDIEDNISLNLDVPQDPSKKNLPAIILANQKCAEQNLQTNNVKQAIIHLQAVVDFSIRHFGYWNSDVASSYLKLGEQYAKDEKYSEACYLIKEAKAISANLQSSELTTDINKSLAVVVKSMKEKNIKLQTDAGKSNVHKLVDDAYRYCVNKDKKAFKEFFDKQSSDIQDILISRLHYRGIDLNELVNEKVASKQLVM